jgi:tRNA (mo5U34)-methyltransferase
VARVGLRWLSRWKPQASLPDSSPNPTGAIVEAGNLITEAGRAVKAREWVTAATCYREALAMDAGAPPPNGGWLTPQQRATVFARLGHVLRDQGDAAGAEDAFEQATSLDPTLEEAHYFLGLLLQRRSRPVEAAARYFEGLKLTGSPALRQGLVELDYSGDEIDDALAMGRLPDLRSIPDDPDFPPRPIDGLAERIKSYYWFHSINLGEGIITPGLKTRYDISREAATIFGPLSLRGRTVADIGAWNGCFTVEAKRRGAGRMLAIDDHAWTDPGLRGKETFDLVMSRLGIAAETRLLDIQKASPEAIGRWQVVLFLGVFYHLFDPIAALKCLAAITVEVLVLETHMELQELAQPAMAFYPGRELVGDPTNWWAPNRAAVEALLQAVGFSKVLFTPHPIGSSNRGIFHAFKSETIYQQHAAAASNDASAFP